eukprot:Hpha_TRINITY_DN22835_c0_g1::TRINITY_DN22835_c0_g1_i1::g.84441::m.84441
MRGVHLVLLAVLPAVGATNACVQATCPAIEGVGSPVFIQTLPEGKVEQTFPSGRCLPCHLYHRGECRSARVDCPTTWMSPSPVERVWSESRNCSGEPDRVTPLPVGFARCPGPKHYSVDRLDLERFVPKLQRDHPSYFPDERTARESIEEYRRMLTVAQTFRGQSIVPSKLVDLVWHEHILDTKAYRRDTLRMFGEYIHHNPSFGGDEEKVGLVAAQHAMFQNYKSLFGVPPQGTWPAAREVGGQVGGAPLPDCCGALCAKPQCQSCVGCDAIDCAYLAATEDGPKFHLETELSPHAGYVPFSGSVGAGVGLTTPLCTMNPMAAMTLSWTVCNDMIYLSQTLHGQGWFSVGFSDQSPMTSMSLADFVLNFPTGNYTGVRDAYRWAPGNGYPCFDVEHECSKNNKTAGTMDLLNGQITRTGDTTTATWNRLLKTADYKDTAIPNGDISVLVARGQVDYMYYHNSDRNVCTVNFFTGKHSCASPHGPR